MIIKVQNQPKDPTFVKLTNCILKELQNLTNIDTLNSCMTELLTYCLSKGYGISFEMLEKDDLIIY